MEPEEDATNGMAVMMSAFATAGGGVGVAYANTVFRTLGLLQFQDTDHLADLEGVVVQVRTAHSGCYGSLVHVDCHRIECAHTLSLLVFIAYTKLGTRNPP